MKLRIIVVVTVLCIVYLDSSCATPASLVNPSSLGKIQPHNTLKASNGSVIIQHTRIRRKACSRKVRDWQLFNSDMFLNTVNFIIWLDLFLQEHWTHRCRTECECGNGRYCSSYGFCHDLSRERRQYGYNVANVEDWTR